MKLSLEDGLYYGMVSPTLLRGKNNQIRESGKLCMGALAVLRCLTLVYLIILTLTFFNPSSASRYFVVPLIFPFCCASLMYYVYSNNHKNALSEFLGKCNELCRLINRPGFYNKSELMEMAQEELNARSDEVLTLEEKLRALDIVNSVETVSILKYTNARRPYLVSHASSEQQLALMLSVFKYFELVPKDLCVANCLARVKQNKDNAWPLFHACAAFPSQSKRA